MQLIKYIRIYIGIFLILTMVLASCNRQPATRNRQPKTDTSATPVIIKINPDSLTIITPGQDNVPLPQKYIAGQPKVVLTNTNIHKIPEIKKIPAGTPLVLTPGEDTILKPETVPINFDSVPVITAGIPEITIAKDPYIRDRNPENFSSFSKLQGLKHDVIRCMIQDRSGNLWFGTSGGVSKYDGKTFTHFTEKEGLSNNIVLSILEDRSGNLWFGTSGGGVSKYDGKTFTHFTEKEGLSNNYVFGMCFDKNDCLWLGTRFGLSKLPALKRAKLVKKIDICKKNGTELAENEVFFKNYGYDDGFLGIGVNGGNTGKNVYEASDGTIWIAANDRLTAYHPEGYVPDTIPPNVQLTGIELFGESVQWVNLDKSRDTSYTLDNGIEVGNFQFDGLTRWYCLPENLSLAYNNNNLTFNFIGITMNQPKKVKYQYMLEGMDKNWSAITNRTYASYGNLPHGTYTFRLKAMNGEGYWSKEFTYTFEIRPPWWLTWWFRTIYITFAVLALFGIYRWRTAAMRRRQKELVIEVRKATLEISEKNEELNQQNEEITAQRDEIETQRDEIAAQRDLVMEQKQELEKLSIVASETENGVLICDKDGTFEWVNRGFERLYGLTLEQFTEKHGKTIYETSSNPDFKEVVNEAVEHNRSITYNSQFIKETGATIWLQTTLTPIFDTELRPVAENELYYVPDEEQSPDRGEIFVTPDFSRGIAVSSAKASQLPTQLQGTQLHATQDNIQRLGYRLKKLVAIESDITKIKEAEEYIREQHKEITDSINYAKRIQTSALPDLSPVKKSLSDIFVLFKPKDVVSGDFYWYAEVENQIVITVADCTGHGVPGAFMSMMGMSMLKEIVIKEYVTQPDVILRKLRKEVIKALGQKGEPGEQKDGMDMSLCSINKETFELQWSGANNPCLLVRNGEFTDIKPDKMPIAIYEKMDRFTLHEIQLTKGDLIYLIGDGYPDQFGGPKGKKFMSKKLKELLLEISSKPMIEQHEILDNTITDWMTGHEEKYEQTDDITIMGIKI
ncbi:MAG: SpoIIE family protein phosphatase [Candidatus Zixiibacteriota bacterium]